MNLQILRIFSSSLSFSPDISCTFSVNKKCLEDNNSNNHKGVIRTFNYTLGVLDIFSATCMHMANESSSLFKESLADPSVDTSFETHPYTVI